MSEYQWYLESICPAMILCKRAIALLAPILLAARAFAYDYDILVYGSTPAGIQAAVAAAGEGRTALIVISDCAHWRHDDGRAGRL